MNGTYEEKLHVRDQFCTLCLSPVSMPMLGRQSRGPVRERRRLSSPRAL